MDRSQKSVLHMHHMLLVLDIRERRHIKEAQVIPYRFQKSSDLDKFKVEEIQLLLYLCCQSLITKITFVYACLAISEIKLRREGGLSNS